MSDRWIANKFGLFDFWYYDEEEFELSNGKIIKRSLSQIYLLFMSKYCLINSNLSPLKFSFTYVWLIFKAVCVKPAFMGKNDFIL